MSGSSIRVAMIAAECEPWAKTGGLADVVDALARALGQIDGGRAGPRLSQPVDVFLPLYRGIRVPDGASRTRLRVPDPHGLAGVTELEIVDVAADGYRLRLVDHPAAYDRDDYYGGAPGDFPDNPWRFGLLCRAALEQLRAEAVPPDVLHLHDWHAVPAQLLRDGEYRDDPAIGRAATILTIHNLAYRGWTPNDRLGQLGLAPGDPLAGRNPDGLDLLAAGVDRADLVNTVSPGFAAEALEPGTGMGLDGNLRARGDRFFGILNGIDTDLWDPATDPDLPTGYSRENRHGKAACRAGLLEEVGLDPKDDGAVLAMVGRLDPQKGFDLLAAAAPELLDHGARLVVLGTGHADHVDPLRDLAARRKRRVAFIERFDRHLARRIYAGADGFLMPSRFEPCGTGQMVALRYGTPPIVRATGGLRDTVIDVTANPDSGDGYTFDDATPEALVEACERFIEERAAGGPRWEGILERGMSVDFDWRGHSAPRYLEAYGRAIALRRRGS